MHFQFLIEDQSSAVLIEKVMCRAGSVKQVYWLSA